MNKSNVFNLFQFHIILRKYFEDIMQTVLDFNEFIEQQTKLDLRNEN